MIQIQLRPEIESQLAHEAQAKDIALSSYIEQIIEARPIVTSNEHHKRQKAVEEMLAFRRDYKATLGDTKIRELIHEGRRI